MKILVTGAGGFLGSALVRELKRHGHFVRALMRRKETAFKLHGLEVEIFICNVLDKDGLKDAVKDIDIVFHTAARVKTDYPFYQKHPPDIYSINVEGTENVLEAAYKADVKKVIYTSSIATVGKRLDGKPADESVPLNLLHRRSHYEKSKSLAEKIAISYHDKGLHVVVVNPGFLVGIKDTLPTPIGEMLIRYLNRAYLCYFDGIMYVADLELVVEAHLKAMAKGKSGERYIVVKRRSYAVKEIFGMIERITGIKGPRIKLPLFVVYAVSILNEICLEILCLKGRLSPIISSESVRYLMLNAKYDGSKARREFILKDKPLEATLKAEIGWYMRNGYIRKSSRIRYYKKIGRLKSRERSHEKGDSK